MNKVFLTGRLTKDIEVRYTQSKKAVTSFTVAVEKFRQRRSGFYLMRCVELDG
jgi:single-strand DNA-binding protein